ncbi:MAG: ATP-binding protein [Pseudomonadota bacterium]
MIDLNEIIGQFSNIENISAQGEYLQLGFQPSSVPLKERWRNNGLSADFMGDYVTTFFPKNEKDPQSITRQAEIKSAVSYIANELLENAMKYSDENLEKSISISLILEQNQIIITETNFSKPTQALLYKDFATKLSISDPMEMYVEQLEASALGDGNSGLGFLTMINDYNAELAWKFTTPSEQSETTITTEVRLPI